LFGQSLWDDDLFGIDKLWQHQRRLLNEQKKKAEMARRNAMRQASVDAKRATDEVQTKSEVAEAKPGEVAEKKPKVVYQHFGSWEPKVEKGDNYVVTTYGPVGYRVHYSHDNNETTEEKPTEDKQTEEEATKME